MENLPLKNVDRLVARFTVPLQGAQANCDKNKEENNYLMVSSAVYCTLHLPLNIGLPCCLVTKAGKKPQERKASSKLSTKAFSKLGEEMSQSVPGSLQDHPMTSLESNNCSQSATSVFQDSSTSLSPYSAKAVTCPTVSTSQVAPSVIDHLSCYKPTSTSLIQSPAISTTQTHTPGLFSTSLIQSPTISITQTHTPSVSVNRSKIFALPQPQPPTPMIQTPHISVSQASGQKSSVPLSRIGASQPVSSSTQASPSVVTSGSSLNNLLSTLVSQILAHPIYGSEFQCQCC